MLRDINVKLCDEQIDRFTPDKYMQYGWLSSLGSEMDSYVWGEAGCSASSTWSSHCLTGLRFWSLF